MRQFPLPDSQYPTPALTPAGLIPLFTPLTMPRFSSNHYSIASLLYRISTGACTPRSANPEANTKRLAVMSAMRAAVRIPSSG